MDLLSVLRGDGFSTRQYIKIAEYLFVYKHPNIKIKKAL